MCIVGLRFVSQAPVVSWLFKRWIALSTGYLSNKTSSTELSLVVICFSELT